MTDDKKREPAILEPTPDEELMPDRRAMRDRLAEVEAELAELLGKAAANGAWGTLTICARSIGLVDEARLLLAKPASHIPGWDAMDPEPKNDPGGSGGGG